MDKLETKFFNRNNLYYEVGFLAAMQRWKKEPNISFLRIFKETFTQNGLWPEGVDISRDDMLDFVLRYMQTSMCMQTICYAYEIIENSGLDQANIEVKNKLKDIKTNLDVNGVEKTTNAMQLIKFIREAFAHNNDNANISNWRIDEEFKVTIQSEINKTGTRHNITFSAKELFDLACVYLSHLSSLDRHAIELDVNGVKLEKLLRKGNALPVQIAKRIKQANALTGEKKEMDEHQLKALENCFKEKFFHDEDVKNRLASPYRPDFIARIYPYDFNGYNHIADLKIVSDSLGLLPTNYQTQLKWFGKMVNYVENSQDVTCDQMTYLFYLFMSGKSDAVFISNILFSIFSFEDSQRIEQLFSDQNIDINRIRNSVMHGRFYYNYNRGFDFYDGRSNGNLTYIGTLSVGKITRVAQDLMHEHISDITSEGVV